MDYIKELQDKIISLEKENTYLKSLLDNAQIPYNIAERAENVILQDSNQGIRILHREITDKDANLFFSMFWGRTDVYSVRKVNRTTKEIGYFTQCSNFWKNGCPRIYGSNIKCRDCTKRIYKKLEIK